MAITKATASSVAPAAAGDLVYGSGTNDAAVLALGTAGQILAVNSGATAPEWVTPAAGGMTQIATGTLSGSEVVLSSIPQTYEHLFLTVTRYSPTTNAQTLRCRVNGDSGSNRHATYETIDGQGVTTGDATSWLIQPAADTSTPNGQCAMWIYNYTVTNWKFMEAFGISENSGGINFERYCGTYNQAAAVSSLNLFSGSGNMSGGDYILYGVK